MERGPQFSMPKWGGTPWSNDSSPNEDHSFGLDIIEAMHVVHGQAQAPIIANRFAEAISRMSLEGVLYLGYPILPSSDEPITVDGLLISRVHGVTVFVFDTSTSATPPAWEEIKDRQDEMAFALSASLAKNRELRHGRELAFKIGVVTVLPQVRNAPNDIVVTGPDSPEAALDRVSSPVPPEYWEAVNAAIQRVTTIKPRKKRTEVASANSRGAILKKIEAEIANLDRWQQWAAIESPNGPQRIRGLAGSGKTIVLALKAAYLHAHHPEWQIAVTFYSRALYQQFKDLIRRFSFEHSGDEPNWDRLHVLHSWGGRGRAGMYTAMADGANAIARDWTYAKSQYGSARAFEGVCKELESIVATDPPVPIFDAVLIDEAQDLPRPFFHLVHAFTKDPKRIVWAFDELQNLSDTAMPTTGEMFGRSVDGTPRVILGELQGHAKQDIVLPVCYRNTPWALSLAHALGFGVYRDGGLVQHFDDPRLWLEIGYELVSGELNPGEFVKLKRKADSYPSYFETLLTVEDAVQAKGFADYDEQVNWVALEVKKNLTTDELEHDDILIVLGNPLTARKKAPNIMRALDRLGIESHLVGETTSSDEMFVPGSVAITHIYRAKGNEAPMVYVVDSQECVSGLELAKLRNMLFTAITRSRAWVRLSGDGFAMQALLAEIGKVVGHHYQLEFRIPTATELKSLRRVHRDLSEGEKRKIREVERGLEKALRGIESGEVEWHALPEDIRRRLLQLGQQQDETQ